MKEQSADISTLLLHADHPGEQISRHIYGHFAEHLGQCIYEGIWVGTDSDIPNTNGIRNDVVAALRGIRAPVLRWPGGCFADEYHWMDGIGPRAQRPASINTHWGGVTENNHFGTHEFLALCALVGCEPYICGNLGSGTVREMQQWVEYLTCDGTSPMTELRRANGRADPWKVRFWGVGNESWGCGGQMSPEYYADQYRRYATYCRNFGENRLYKIACGPSDFDYRWTEVLMREAGKYMDGLSLHYYILPGAWESKGPAVAFDEHAWFEVLRKTLLLDEVIAKHSAIMDGFDPGKRVGLIVDEWGTWYDPEPGTNPGFLQQQNTLRDAVVAGAALNIFNNRCGRVRMANIAQTVNVLQAIIQTRGREMILTPTYHTYEIYTPHQDATLLPVDLTSGRYAYGEQSIPAISASASRDSSGLVHLSLCNLDPEREQQLSCELRGIQPSRVSGRVLSARTMDARNTFDKPDGLAPVPFDGTRLRESTLSVAMPPKSVVMLEIQ